MPITKSMDAVSKYLIESGSPNEMLKVLDLDHLQTVKIPISS